MNNKELNLITLLIKEGQERITHYQEDIKYYQMHYDCVAKKELDEKIKQCEYNIKRELEDISTLKSIYTKVRAVQIAHRSYVGKDDTFTEHDILTMNRAGMIVK